MSFLAFPSSPTISAALSVQPRQVWGASPTTGQLLCGLRWLLGGLAPQHTGVTGGDTAEQWFQAPSQFQLAHGTVHPPIAAKPATPSRSVCLLLNLP